MVTIVNRNDQMDVRELQIFLSVAKHLNYTRAGEEVNLSQPERLCADEAIGARHGAQSSSNNWERRLL